jgi:predicted RNA-binding protein with TRAM domain
MGNKAEKKLYNEEREICMIEKGQNCELMIEDMSAEGQGIGRIEGMAIFVEGALVGDVVKAELTKLKKNYAFGRLTEIVAPSPHRIEPSCRYAGDSFLVMVRCADTTGVETVAWRLKKRIDDLTITARGQLVPITASVGHVTYPVCAAREPDSLVKEALLALRKDETCDLRVAS